MSGFSRPVWSALFTASTTGFPERRSRLATSWSEAVMPVLMSHTKTITVAVEMAISACSRIKGQDLVIGARLDASGIHKCRTPGFRHSRGA